MKPAVKANLLFLLVAVIWGGTFPIIKSVVDAINPNAFVAIRFGVAALALLPWALSEIRLSTRSMLTAGAVLGVLNALAYVLQTMSLEYISASRCAFITGVNVIMVPNLGRVLGLAHLKKVDLIATMICLLGLYVLTGADLHDLNRGDALVFVSAIAAALSIVYLHRVSVREKHCRAITFYQIALTVPLPLLAVSGLSQVDFSVNIHIIWALAYCAFLATIIPMYVQTRFQKDSNPTQIALIFALEPVFACLFAAWFYHEALTQQIILGGIIMLCSMVLPLLPGLLKYRP